jgi:hypothetical protein
MNTQDTMNTMNIIHNMNNALHILDGENVPHRASEPIIDIMQNILKLPYYKNSPASSSAVHGDSGHEQIIEQELISGGFEKGEALTKNEKKVAREWINCPNSCNRPSGTFIYQPFGQQSNPDFIVKVSDNLVLFLEAKSCKNVCPLYNSGGVNLNYLYVFCSKKYNKTTIYFGRDIISDEKLSIIEEWRSTHKILDKKFNDKLNDNAEGHERGWHVYSRPMIMQQGGAEFTNYFTHKDRKNTEEKALKWVKDHM